MPFILPLNMFKARHCTDRPKQQEMCLVSEQEEFAIGCKDILE